MPNAAISANIAIPHRKSMKCRNRKNLVYYSHYALQVTKIAWFRIYFCQANTFLLNLSHFLKIFSETKFDERKLK